MKSVFYETIDIKLGELERKFSDNQELISTIIAAEELKEETGNYDTQAQLGITILPKEEMMVAERYLREKVLKKL